MKGQLAALVIAVTALNAGMVQADSRETCDAYRLEIIQLKAGLDQKYGENRVLRGGSWRDAPDRCRSAARSSEEPGFADVCFGYEAYGFRCVRRIPDNSSQGE